ncbi:MAG: ABC transporter ATP-binding protein [Lachnospiraceae bacterium]|nr:ABC transporter ATP-binding protein [Lachnospiraceae bacterium]
MMSIIKVNEVSKSFGEKENLNLVLDKVSLDIKKGEFVSLMGESGSGKSTLLYIIGGLDKPTSGTVVIDEKDINTLKEKEIAKFRRQDIGFVFQFYNLVQNLTVEENIMLPVVMDGKKEKDYKDRLDKILKIVGLEEKRKSLPNQLSGGQQQRVSIARAVIMNPKVILADEPIGNLDSKSGEEVMKLFKTLNEEENVTILQVTHSEESAKYGNRIIRLKDGKIV